MILMMDLKVLKSRCKAEKVYFACCIKFAFENKTIALKSSNETWLMTSNKPPCQIVQSH